MHGMNGRIYGNLEGLEMTVGDNVRWFVGSLGSQVLAGNCDCVYALLYTVIFSYLAVCNMCAA
jgi:hypothetical protein